MPDITHTDVAAYSRLAKPGSPLRMVLLEVMALQPKVGTWITQATSGSAICQYDRATGEASAYTVRYQNQNVGNLVHEMIHVAVNESYGLDFINFAIPADSELPERVYTDSGYCSNEAERQTAAMKAGTASMTRIEGTLMRLIGWANASKELTEQQRTTVVEKLTYGTLTPHKEYDTVITQVLVWLFEWGYPTVLASGPMQGPKPVVNALYEEVEKAVLAAYQARKAARVLLEAARVKEVLRKAMALRRKQMGMD